jgi:hypothetical protein
MHLDPFIRKKVDFLEQEIVVSEKKLQLPTIHRLHHQHYKKLLPKISHMLIEYLK